MTTYRDAGVDIQRGDEFVKTNRSVSAFHLPT